jgi:ribosomal protein S18 acetylase RimI-like enzyme
MINADFDRILEINHSSSGDYFWEPDDLWNEWKAEQGVGIVAVDREDYPFGFCIYSLDNKEFYEIKHFVVDKYVRRQGIGTALINKMKSKLNDRRSILSYSVPEENLPFQLFLKKMDFRARIVNNGTSEVYRFEYTKE